MSVSELLWAIFLIFFSVILRILHISGAAISHGGNVTYVLEVIYIIGEIPSSISNIVCNYNINYQVNTA